MSLLPVVLVQPPVTISSDFVDYPYHCDLSVVQLAPVLREAGFPVAVVDSYALPSSAVTAADGGFDLGPPTSAVVNAVPAASVIVVALTPFHCPPRRSRVLGETLRGLRAVSPSTPIVLADLYQGGQHFLAVDGGAVLHSYPEADLYLQYEAEATLPALCSALCGDSKRADRRVIAGNSTFSLTGLPAPDWRSVDLEARDAFMRRVATDLGRGSWPFPLEGRTLPALSSRGCPFRCVHCSSNPGLSPSAAKAQRRIDGDDLVRLVASLKAVGADRVHFLDELANAHGGHFDALLDLVESHGLLCEFPNGLRADRLDDRQISRLAKLITTLSVSAESGSQRVLDDIVGKQLDLGRLERTVRSATGMGLQTIVHFIIGFPGETKKEINQTLSFATRLWESTGATPAVQFATPLPGTQLHDLAAPYLECQDAAVTDYGPLFQHEPIIETDDFSKRELARFKWTFDQRIVAGRDAKKLILNLTYRCNNHCSFCAVGDRPKVDGGTEQQLRTLLDFRRRGVDRLDLDGGEPTLHRGVLKLIRFACQIGYRSINLTTNGRTSSYEDFARKLVNSGLTSILVSLHGADAATHERHTEVEGSFLQTRAGLENLLRNRPSSVSVGVNTTVTQLNFRGLPDLAELIWNLGARALNLQFLTPFGRATGALQPNLEEAARVVAEVIEQWRERLNVQVINLPFCFLPNYEEHIVGDLLKVERHMVFVWDEEVNLSDYLAEKRHHQQQCGACPHRVFCSGFYDLGDVDGSQCAPGGDTHPECTTATFVEGASE